MTTTIEGPVGSSGHELLTWSIRSHYRLLNAPQAHLATQDVTNWLTNSENVCDMPDCTGRIIRFAVQVDHERTDDMGCHIVGVCRLHTMSLYNDDWINAAKFDLDRKGDVITVDRIDTAAVLIDLRRMVMDVKLHEAAIELIEATPEAKNLLDVQSVTGRDFRDLLAEATGLPQEDVAFITEQPWEDR
jgi:hypothetical protein